MLPFLSPLFAPLFRRRLQLPQGIVAPRMTFEFECRDAEGNLKWRDSASNLVTNAGRTDLVNKYLKGSAYTAAWYMLLKGAGAVANGDTLASPGAWTEFTSYTGSRPAITWGTASGTTTVSLSATAVSFSITGSGTVAGAGCCTVASGTSGTLYNVSDFAASRTVANGDTMSVTPTLTAT